MTEFTVRITESAPVELGPVKVVLADPAEPAEMGPVRVEIVP